MCCHSLPAVNLVFSKWWRKPPGKRSFAEIFTKCEIETKTYQNKPNKLKYNHVNLPSKPVDVFTDKQKPKKVAEKSTQSETPLIAVSIIR